MESHFQTDVVGFAQLRAALSRERFLSLATHGQFGVKSELGIVALLHIPKMSQWTLQLQIIRWRSPQRLTRKLGLWGSRSRFRQTERRQGDAALVFLHCWCGDREYRTRQVKAFAAEPRRRPRPGRGQHPFCLRIRQPCLDPGVDEFIDAPVT